MVLPVRAGTPHEPANAVAEQTFPRPTRAVALALSVLAIYRVSADQAPARGLGIAGDPMEEAL
jgi:hypothetical protein